MSKRMLWKHKNFGDRVQALLNSMSFRLKHVLVEEMPSNTRIQRNAGTTVRVGVLAHHSISEHEPIKPLSGREGGFSLPCTQAKTSDCVLSSPSTG